MAVKLGSEISNKALEKPGIKAIKPKSEMTNAEMKKELSSVQRGETKARDATARPGNFRQGVRDQVWENAKDSHGRVRDPATGRFMSKDKPWDMGHKPGHEFRKHQESARERGIDRKQFLDEYNNPDHYRPELPGSNRSHKMEDKTSYYAGD